MTWFSAHRLDIAGVEVSYLSIIVALGVLAGGFLFASIIASRLRGDASRLRPDRRWRTALAQFVGYGIRLAAFAVALQITGIDIASILAAGAVVAVGIGIAMQKVAENFVSGIILLAENSIREGDIIEFEGRVARVRSLGIRSTIAITLDDEEIIVPNSILAQSPVKNLTLTDSIHRLRVCIGVAYSTDLVMADAVLRQAACDIPWRESNRDPVVLLLDFGASSVDFEVSVWTSDVWKFRWGQSELRMALWKALQEAGITIPFPQMDVHLHKPAESAP